MKLIQLNAWAWRLYQPVKRFLQREQPDFLMTQESINGTSYIKSDCYTANGIIEEGLMDYVAEGGSIPFGTRYGTELDMSVAIFGKQPLETVAIVPIVDQVDYSWISGPDYHQLLHTKTDVEGKPLNLLTYHGRVSIDESLPYDGKMGTPVTKSHMNKIGAYIATLNGPTIFTGDLNLLPDAEAFAPINQRLRNLVTFDDMPNGRNEFAWKSDEIVNHMFVSPEVKVKSFRVAREPVSDHHPLIMEFRL